MSLAYAFALLLPVLTGAALYIASCGLAAPAERSTALGYGALFGLLLAAAFTALSSHTDTAHAWQHAAIWLVPIAAVALLFAWRRTRSIPQPNETLRPAPWQRLLLVALGGALMLRLALAAREIWLRPLYPWDAWAAWAVKGKVWYLLGHHVAYVAPRDWFANGHENLYTVAAWFYPDTFAWLDIWFASAAGGWIEPLLNLPWLVVWVALLLGHYGQWRVLGMGSARALFFVYALGSLPLLTVHAALAGYADLWVATALGFGVLAWMRWLQRRERAQLVLAVLCALALPFLKLEGWVWMIGMLAAIGFGALPSRWRWRVGLVAAMLILLLVSGALRFAFAKLGWIDAQGVLIDQRLGAFTLLLNLHWHGEAALGILDTLCVHPNWHLLWWLLPVILAWRWRELCARESLWLPALFQLACFAAIAFLFTATDASAWAQSYTAINRLALQLTPAVVSLVAMLLRDVGLPRRSSDTAQARDPRSDPA